MNLITYTILISTVYLIYYGINMLIDLSAATPVQNPHSIDFKDVESKPAEAASLITEIREAPVFTQPTEVPFVPDIKDNKGEESLSEEEVSEGIAAVSNLTV